MKRYESNESAQVRKRHDKVWGNEGVLTPVLNWCSKTWSMYPAKPSICNRVRNEAIQSLKYDDAIGLIGLSKGFNQYGCDQWRANYATADREKNVLASFLTRALLGISCHFRCLNLVEKTACCWIGKHLKIQLLHPTAVRKVESFTTIFHL